MFSRVQERYEGMLTAVIVPRVRLELLVLHFQVVEQTFGRVITGDAVLVSMSDPDPGDSALASTIGYDNLPA